MDNKGRREIREKLGMLLGITEINENNKSLSSLQNIQKRKNNPKNKKEIISNRFLINKECRVRDNKWKNRNSRTATKEVATKEEEEDKVGKSVDSFQMLQATIKTLTIKVAILTRIGSMAIPPIKPSEEERSTKPNIDLSNLLNSLIFVLQFIRR